MTEIDRLCAALALEANNERADALIVNIRLALPACCRGELRHLIKNGPVEAGDVISKTCRDDLVRWGLAVRVLVRGQWGYTAATYTGGHVLDVRVEVTS